MCDPITIAIASAAVTAIGAGVSYENGQKQAKIQKEGLAQSEANALATQKAAEQANNKANAVMPNTAAIEAQNNLTAQGGNPTAGTGPTAGATGAGAGTTMLTGPSGVDPSKLQLGKNTLLGG